MHLTHAHGVPRWPPDITENAVNNSKPMTNQPPSRLEPSMSGRNNDAKQGTDILQSSPNVPENNMRGTNNVNNQHAMGVNIDTPAQNGTQGINIADTIAVKGNNEHLVEAPNDHPHMDTHASDQKPNQTLSEQQ